MPSMRTDVSYRTGLDSSPGRRASLPLAPSPAGVISLAEQALRDELRLIGEAGAPDVPKVKELMLRLTLIQLAASRRGIEFRENVRTAMELAGIGRSTATKHVTAIGYDLPAGADGAIKALNA